jgi:23S rRNA (guanosine2251-2'-O)-methyltransferase
MSGAYDKKRRSRYGDRPVRTGMGNSSEKGDYEQEILEGRNPVLEALRSGRSINKIFVAKGEKEGSINQIIAIARDNKIVVQDVERSKLDGMSETHVHQGVIAFVSAKEYVSVEDILNAAEESGQPPMVIVLDEIADPHNLGSILRSANAAGAHGIIIPKRRAVGLTATVSKASAGAIEYLPVARVTNIAQTLKLLKEKGLWVVGTDSNGEMPYFDYDYKGAVAIVVGSEGAGIRRLVREECDTIVSIPMRGQINSLNASVAAAVVMFEASKQRYG